MAINIKNNKTKEILFHLKNSWRTTKEIFDILPSYREMHRRVFGSMKVPRFDYEEWQRQEEKKFYKLLSKLRKEGLIEKKHTKQQSWWNTTKKGLQRFKFKRKDFNLPNKLYVKKLSSYWNLIIFDIPEKLKHKRAWLRKQLNLLGFKMLQKSVWIGKCGIPNDLIHDLKDLEILSYMHILKIYKKGSITNFED